MFPRVNKVIYFTNICEFQACFDTGMGETVHICHNRVRDLTSVHSIIKLGLWKV